ncbi:hypothetical protein J1N35_007236 [Gossypium stocksii]|uniref:Uncharacterized protein n=1 Tax=Gossypium stocksii TaxID=47602 RepID=A0A9D3W744_9ROSI|nr:hypothetical protein J1N35_007236 [Gossypium stocksii]
MEMLMQRENVREDEETTMVWFVDGLNISIANVFNLQTHIDIDEVVHKAIEIKQQFQQRQSHLFGASQYYKATSLILLSRIRNLFMLLISCYQNMIRLNLFSGKVGLIQNILIHLLKNPLLLIFHQNNKELMKLNVLSAKCVSIIVVIVPT